MRDYQAKSTGYWLPEHIYKRALALVRAYPQMAKQADNSVVTDQIVSITLRYELDAVDRARKAIPAEYRDGVWRNLQDGIAMDRLDYAARNTWSRWRARLLWEVARNMHWI